MRSTLLTVIGFALASSSVHAQMPRFGDPLLESDMLYLAGEPGLALDILREQLARDSTDYAMLWRATRAAVVIGIEIENNRQQNQWLDPAIDWSERAVEIRPGGIDAMYWRGVASGRRAMNAAPGYAVELAQVVYEDAHTILASDSLHGGAHNMLGKLNYEVMSLSRIKRAIARTFMGNEALDDTSWENAEYHLTRAAETWPDFVLFHFDLAQFHRKRGPKEAAIAEFRLVLELPAVHPVDVGLQEQARMYLEDLGEPAERSAVSSGAAPTDR